MLVASRSFVDDLIFHAQVVFPVGPPRPRTTLLYSFNTEENPGRKKGREGNIYTTGNDGLGDWYPGHRKEKMIGHAGGGCENVQQAEELTRSKLDEHVKHEAHTAGAEDLPKKKRNWKIKIAKGCPTPDTNRTTTCSTLFSFFFAQRKHADKSLSVVGGVMFIAIFAKFLPLSLLSRKQRHI